MKKALMALGLGCLVTVVAFAAVAFAHNRSHVHARAADAPAWGSAYQVLAQALSQTSTASLPDGVPTDWGIAPSTVVQIPTPSDAPALIWVAMSSNGPCIFVRPNRLPYSAGPDNPSSATCGGASLDRPPTLALGGVTKGTGTFAPGETIVFGLVPDGVASVTLHQLDGGTTTLPVHQNVYYYDSPEETQSVSFAAPSTGAVTEVVEGVND